MTGDGAVGIGVGDPEHAAASGPRSQNQRRLSDEHTHTHKAGHHRSMQGVSVGFRTQKCYDRRPLLLEEPAEWNV